MTAGLLAVVASTNAVSQEGVALAVRQTTPQPILAPAPSIVLDQDAPADVVKTDVANPDTGPAPSLETLVATNAKDIDNLDRDTECMAKVVHHEAANQPLTGQLAVAEVIVNRTRSGRFPNTPCAVANQRGQFFQTDSYHVPLTSPRWRTAVAIARIAEAGEAPAAAPGALFFHASYAHTDWSSRRTLVAQIAGQIFYR
jgi:spore germination cell wall hydrolase CwlJ-like protein